MRVGGEVSVPQELRLPLVHGAWALAQTPLTRWKPHYINTTLEVQRTYTDGDHEVGVYLAYYGAQDQDAELINSQNVLVVQKHPVWRMPEQYLHVEHISGEKQELYESQLKSASQNLLVWHWFVLSFYLNYLMEK